MQHVRGLAGSLLKRAAFLKTLAARACVKTADACRSTCKISWYHQYRMFSPHAQHLRFSNRKETVQRHATHCSLEAVTEHCHNLIHAKVFIQRRHNDSELAHVNHRLIVHVQGQTRGCASRTMHNGRITGAETNYLTYESRVCACGKRTGAAASVERRRREPARAISPE